MRVPVLTAAIVALCCVRETVSFARLFSGDRFSAARALEEDDDCTDKAGAGQCKTWADAGECSANYGWMSEHCQKSCHKCKARPYESHDTLAACKDDHGECRTWAQEEECEKNPTFMLTSCRAACHQCQSLKCFDAHPECVEWAHKGECHNNTDFMLAEVSCPRGRSPRELAAQPGRSEAAFTARWALRCAVQVLVPCVPRQLQGGVPPRQGHASHGRCGHDR